MIKYKKAKTEDQRGNERITECYICYRMETKGRSQKERSQKERKTRKEEVKKFEKGKRKKKDAGRKGERERQ